MEKWIDKVAVVTGASSGIGSAVVKDLLRAGCIVVGLARRVDKITALDLEHEIGGRKGVLYAKHCDVSKLDSVKNAFEWIDKELGGISILINNAGIATSTNILDENNEKILMSTMDTNFMGLIFCTKQAYKSFTKYNTNGYIINVNSVAGHKVFFPAYCCNVYPSSKFAVTAATEVLNGELAALKNPKIRVTSISPGFVDSEILDMNNIRGEVSVNYGMLKAEDVSAEIIHILSQPPHIHILELKLQVTPI